MTQVSSSIEGDVNILASTTHRNFRELEILFRVIKDKTESEYSELYSLAESGRRLADEYSSDNESLCHDVLADVANTKVPRTETEITRDKAGNHG